MSEDDAALLARCHHPLVRDLAWIVLAPDLIRTPWPGRPSRADLGLAGDDRLGDWLDECEANPQALERRVGNTVDGRMGHYHERLWQYLLDAAPGTRLLASNLRIHEGKRTLGELDLLYRRLDDPTPVHLEVAIKFYLGLPAGPGPDNGQARWIGPGGADSLATKREHLDRHQLRLTERVETRTTIRQHTHPRDLGPSREVVIRRQLAIPGVLFYPWQAPMPAPLEAATAHLRGHWLRWGDWPRLRDGLARDTRSAWLVKPHWLALPRDEAFVPLRDVEARLAQHFSRPAAPVQIALLGPLARGRRHQRLFIVDDSWPLQIPLPPRPPA
ncbi:DUF1853 family protein [Halomonas sp. MCCC 1A17488]|uniref:DUF1853 family protein n=1 Tax=unclassified Halomonas TaxID=2609666 RepID=UPI0018D24568|nr:MULTISPECIES: DUF1853 family protein [unclassified Halomonas]MCE8015225.1 DUF1853 family protein [Halomonas sp. MCCC 1A17488]MCG3238558.1 DUF1853 family protein [Halomonas sp. MCCC 1A17488]QPP47706.1 DUF1853 family protein [Halomonas sp. SS10-MC5]